MEHYQHYLHGSLYLPTTPLTSNSIERWLSFAFVIYVNIIIQYAILCFCLLSLNIIFVRLSILSLIVAYYSFSLLYNTIGFLTGVAWAGGIRL